MIRAYATAIAEASVGVNTPIRMPPSMMIGVGKVATAIMQMIRKAMDNMRRKRNRNECARMSMTKYMTQLANCRSIPTMRLIKATTAKHKTKIKAMLSKFVA